MALKFRNGRSEQLSSYERQWVNQAAGEFIIRQWDSKMQSEQAIDSSALQGALETAQELQAACLIVKRVFRYAPVDFSAVSGRRGVVIWASANADSCESLPLQGQYNVLRDARSQGLPLGETKQ